MLMGDLELVESYDGHYDVVYGTYDPKYLTRKSMIVNFKGTWSKFNSNYFDVIIVKHLKLFIREFLFHPNLDGTQSKISSSLGNGFVHKMEHILSCNFQQYIRKSRQD
uniref:Uncharacterized protein LOC113785029 n=1 Tax=Cicer arietinum TaxID=3827 RepID=A0A3Q7XTF3_CICAR|nr:uncharacterized protein LOC113785029 [Cicer arietinum]